MNYELNFELTFAEKNEYREVGSTMRASGFWDMRGAQFAWKELAAAKEAAASIQEVRSMDEYISQFSL